MTTSRAIRLRGTTALGMVLCVVGGLFALLAMLIAVSLLLQPGSLKPGILIGPVLTVLSRSTVFATGILLLRRSPKTAMTASLGIGMSLLSGAFDVLLFESLLKTSAVARNALVGSLCVLGVLVLLLVITLIYIKRRKVQVEFAAGPGESVAGA